MGHTQIYGKWVDRIDSGVLTKSQTLQFAQAISRRVAMLRPHGRPTNLTDTEAWQLFERLHREPVKLTEPHTQQGITWFAKHARKALDITAAEVDDIVSKFSHFTYNGEIQTTGPYDNGTLPVWTLHLTDGRVLQYYNGAWQSSIGGPEKAWWWVREHVATEF